MFRFIAIIFDPRNELQLQYAKRLQHQLDTTPGTFKPVLKTEALSVYCTGTRPGQWNTYPLSHNLGVVLGKLFPHTDHTKVFDERETSQITSSLGRVLLKRYWGRYVAILYDSETFTTRVIRDPSGIVPCFAINVSGVHVLFSNTEDCIRLGIPLSLHWDWLKVHLTSNVNERLSGTALREVDPIHPGECFTIAPGEVARSFYWDPFEIATTDVIEDHAEAVEALRHAVDHCVHSWASCHERIIHRLSGGLDSSIIASCLSYAPSTPSVTCFNHYSPGLDSDERRYAHLAADNAGFPLIEHPRVHSTHFKQLHHLNKHPYPMLYRYSLDYGRYEADLAKNLRATAVFSGEWGDPLFYVPAEMHPAIDYVQQHPLGTSTFKVALDTSRNEGCTVWSALYQAYAQGLTRRKRWDHRTITLARYRTLLSQETISYAVSNTDLLHPWLRRETDVPIGKIKHIYDCLLIDLDPIYDHFHEPGDAEHVAPLYSQPLIELCLRIPTYVLATGAWNRAIARRAFADQLPIEIVTRRTKGGVKTHHKAVFASNIDHIRTLLLEGTLANKRIIDRAKLETALSWEPSRLNTILPELYFYLCAEAWIANWQTTRQLDAA